MKLTFITGKGGVGKSAVTAALATVLAALKFKVGIVELEESRMADFFGVSPPDYTGTSITPHITILNLNAQSCFEEYAARHLPKKALLLIKNRWVHHFIDATPGLNEILLLGKISSLVEEESWDFLLVDAPATGHTISLCDAPRIAFQALRLGPLKSTVGKIWDLLHRSKQTHFLLVTQLENFIVQETTELYQHLTKTLELAPQGIVVNGVLGIEMGLIEEMPKKLPLEAKPLIEILMAAQTKRTREQTLLKELKSEIPLNFGELPWEGIVTEESHLRQTMAVKLKPWVLQNYSNKNV